MPRLYTYYLLNNGQVISSKPVEGGYKAKCMAQSMAEAHEAFETAWVKDLHGRFTTRRDLRTSALAEAVTRSISEPRQTPEVVIAVSPLGLKTTIRVDGITIRVHRGDAVDIETNGDITISGCGVAGPTPTDRV